MKRRIRNVLLSLLMILALIPGSGIAALAEEGGYQDYAFTLEGPESASVEAYAEWTDLSVQCTDLMAADLGSLDICFFAGVFKSDYSDAEIPFLLGTETHEMQKERQILKE